MTLSLLLAWVGAIAGLSAAGLFAVHKGMRKHIAQERIQVCSLALEDIERSARNGGLDAASAAAARQGVLRELLLAQPNKQPHWWAFRGDRSALLIGILSALAVFGLAAPLAMEGADNGGWKRTTPVAGRRIAPRDAEVARLEAYAQGLAPPSANDGQDKQGLPDVETMIERLAARLETAPADVEGWRMLGWSYANVQQPAKAADAYARAVKLQPRSAELRLAYAEALVATASGTVTADAVVQLERTLTLEPGHAEARYFLTLAKAQSGKKQDALSEWRSLQTQIKAQNLDDEPWVADLRQRVQALAAELGEEASGAIGGHASMPKMPSRGSLSQPLPEILQRIQTLPSDRRQGLIRSMVDGLENRLRSEPKDEEGWLRLIRSRVVLGEPEPAHEALKHALAIFGDDEQARMRILAGAKQLGVSKD
jgi:cytochrome c-type biogenesis protein CcmH